MIITTIEEFIKYIPTAEGSNFTAIKPYLAEAENQLIGLFLGNDLYNYLETIVSPDPEATPPVEAGADYQMKVIFSRLLCLQAYENAIPFVDLIQTNNGFAVVSNSNQAPASKERVERLIEWVESQIYINSDMLIQSVMKSADALTAWTTFSEFEELTSCLFLTGYDFASYSSCEGSKRKALMTAKSDLISWQKNLLEKVISADYMKQLLTEVKTNSIQESSKDIIRFCKMVLGQMYNKNADQAEKWCNVLSNILDNDLETYTLYANSDEYALRVTPPYENLQTDPTFFFGM